MGRDLSTGHVRKYVDLQCVFVYAQGVCIHVASAMTSAKFLEGSGDMCTCKHTPMKVALKYLSITLLDLRQMARTNAYLKQSNRCHKHRCRTRLQWLFSGLH